MPAAIGDVLGLQCIWMPSGFPVAVAPQPAPTVGGGDIRPRRRPQPVAPTYHAAEVASRVVFIGRTQPAVLAPLSVTAELALAGRAEASRAYVQAALAAGALLPAAVEASLAVALAGVESVVGVVSEAEAMAYYERDVRFVLGLP